MPEHSDSTAPPGAATSNPESDDGDSDHALVSEPAACPFCVQPEFGVTYESPPFRRGLTYVNQASNHPLSYRAEAMSSSSSLASAMSGGGQIGGARRRTTSISATSPAVISTDRIRPDWHQKLASARAIAARRSAAATALHTAAYLMGNQNHDSDGRAFSGFTRRNILRRATGSDSSPAGSTPAQPNMLAMMSERYSASSAGRREGELSMEGRPTLMTIPQRSSRRSRIDELEDMMMMEAIRLSLASEEDRRKREEKEAKREAKKKGKESKRAEKSAKKAGVYQNSAHPSSTAFDNMVHDSRSPYDSVASEVGKLKGVQQPGTGPSSARSSNADLLIMGANPSTVAESSAGSPQGHLERARAQLQPSEATTSPVIHHANPYRPSHLRTLSNASSALSSIEDHGGGSLNQDFHRSNSSFEASPNSSATNILLKASAPDTLLSSTPPGGAAGTEPMFNFRSLAAMVGDDEKGGSTIFTTRGINQADDETNVTHPPGEGPSFPPGHDTTLDPPSIDLDKATTIVEESVEVTPELQITSASGVNSDLDRRNSVSGLKTAEAVVSVNGARSISP